MKEQIIAQDNRLTSARYELSLMEKRIMYVLVRDIRTKFVLNNEGDTTLFKDLIIKTTSSALLKDLKETNPKRVKEAFKSLRKRSFEWDNGKDIETELDEYEGFEVGFINYSTWKRGGDIEFQVSSLILPFFVDLTKKFTEYNLVVAIALKSKWSQRFYEICCQWRVAGGVRLDIKDLREQFGLGDKYERYGAFKKKVIDVAHKELKRLYEMDQSDIYFEYSELKNGRSVESLRLKVISRDKELVPASTLDLTYMIRKELHKIFEVDIKEKNKEKITKLMSHFHLNADILPKVFKKIEYTKSAIPKEDWQKYLRYIFNEEFDFKNL